MATQRIKVKDIPQSFLTWLDEIKKLGLRYEVNVQRGVISHVVVTMNDNGDWKNIEFGRIVGSDVIGYKQCIYKPAIVDNNFVENVDEP